MPQGDEAAFRRWYAEMANRHGLNENPDGQFYDYRAAFRAGAQPDATGHWPSEFKLDGHPNLVVGGFDVRTGARVPGTRRAGEAELVSLGWDPATARQLAAQSEAQGRSMPQSPQYLSMDPTAGEPVAPAASGYLSTDPNAGAPTTDGPVAHPAEQMGLLKSILALAQQVMSQNPGGIGVAAQNVAANHPQDLLPSVGAATGGAVGGGGGTVLGWGVGGLPGAGGGAALGGATGEALKQLIDRATGRPTAPDSATDAATRMATRAALEGTGEVVGGAVVPMIARGSARMMQSALKPTKDMARRVVDNALTGTRVPRVVQTMLDEGVLVTRRGAAHLDRLLGQTDDAIRSAVTNAKGEIQPLDVAARLNPLYKRVSNQVNPVTDQHTVATAAQEFLDTFKSPMSPLQAHDMKVGTYAQMRNAYGELRRAQVESQKALARGLKEEVERFTPGVAEMNQRAGALMDASEAVENRLAVAENRNPLGFANVATDSATRLLTAIVDRWDAAKSLLARGMYRAVAREVRLPEQLIRLAVSVVAQAPDEDESPEAPTP